MTEEFNAASDEHLQRLLETAGRFIAAGDPLSLRLATMCLVDYYQAVLKESAAIVGLSLASERDLAGMLNRLRTRVLGLERISLDDLSKVRNASYHNESRYCLGPELAEHLSRAEGRRRFFLAAAQAAIRYQKVMAVQVQRLLATANEMRLELRGGSKSWKEHWAPKVERATVLARESPLALELEGFELLLELTRQIGSSRTINAMNAVEEVDEEDYGYDPGAESEQEGPEPADYESEPEPSEFEPSDYYPDDSDQGLPEEEPPDPEPPDPEPIDQEPPDEEPPDADSRDPG